MAVQCGTMIRMEVSTIQSFLDYFGKIRERTMRVVACIPPDKIEWRAAAGKFTLGDQHPVGLRDTGSFTA